MRNPVCILTLTLTLKANTFIFHQGISPQNPPLTLCNALARPSLYVSIYLCLSIARVLSFDNPRQSVAFNQVLEVFTFTVQHFSPRN